MRGAGDANPPRTVARSGGTLVPAGLRGVTKPLAPGTLVDPEDRSYVHNEVRELAAVTNQIIKDKFQRHGTNENQILSGVKQFGVSQQTKVIMSREKAAAEMAVQDRVYGVWRNECARHEVNRDFCSRIGPLHKCFCGHTLAEHGPVTSKRGVMCAPKCSGCACDGFQFIPNEPEEVGEHWLARRKDFVPGSWQPKCRCGHASKDHDPRRGGGCRSCGSCFRFEGHFLCIVCDGKFEDHMTIFETEDERQVAGRPVRGDYIPLKNFDWDVQSIVFGDGLGYDQITGGGHQQKALPRSPQAQPYNPSGTPSSSSQRVKAPAPQHQQQRRLPPSDQPVEDECDLCQTPFRTPTSKFCGHCGAKRE